MPSRTGLNKNGKGRRKKGSKIRRRKRALKKKK